KLCQTFLNLKPRPTINELFAALWPLEWDPHKHKNMIPHPDKPGYLKYDSSRWIPDPDNPGETKYNSDPYFVTDYEKLLREESQKRKEVMRQVIKSRGIEIDNSFL
ncbi:MAG: hypothetical protein WBP88_04385, partial [Nitrososphaeraceae archaeon]